MKLFHLYQRVVECEASAIAAYEQAGDDRTLQHIPMEADRVWLRAKRQYAEEAEAVFGATPAGRAIMRVTASGCVVTAVSDTIVHIRVEDGSFAWFALADSVPPFTYLAQRVDGIEEVPARANEWFGQQERIPATQLPAEAAENATAHALFEDGVFIEPPTLLPSMFQLINATLTRVVVCDAYVWSPQLTTFPESIGHAWYDRRLAIITNMDRIPAMFVCRCIDDNFQPNGEYLLRCKKAPFGKEETTRVVNDAALIAALKAFYPTGLHRTHH